MNIFLTTLIGTILLITPALADKADLSKVPKDVLLHGLNTAVVCATIDQYGIKRLVEIYHAANDDPDIAKKAETEATSLSEAGEIEISIANTIVESLKANFNMTADEVIDSVRETVNATDSGLKDKFDEFTEFDEFVSAYEEPLDTCTDAMDSFIKQLKAALAPVQ